MFFNYSPGCLFERITINQQTVTIQVFFTDVPPQVLEVRAKRRTGEHSLVTALRKSLEGHYPDKSLALGGTFIIQKGKAKIHIMVKTKTKQKNFLKSNVENHTKHNRADQVLTQEGTFGFITDSENSKRPTGVVTGGLAVDQYLLNHPL